MSVLHWGILQMHIWEEIQTSSDLGPGMSPTCRRKVMRSLYDPCSGWAFLRCVPSLSFVLRLIFTLGSAPPLLPIHILQMPSSSQFTTKTLTERKWLVSVLRSKAYSRSKLKNWWRKGWWSSRMHSTVVWVLMGCSIGKLQSVNFPKKSYRQCSNHALRELP